MAVALVILDAPINKDAAGVGPRGKVQGRKQTFLAHAFVRMQPYFHRTARLSITGCIFGLSSLTTKDFHRIPDRKSPALDNLGVHAQFHVPVERAELSNRINIALCCLRVHLGRGTAGRALQDPQYGSANLQLAPDPTPLSPGGRPAEPDVGAKAPPVPAATDLRLVVPQTGQVVQTDHFRGLIGEHVPGDVVEAWGATRLLPQIGRQEFTDARSTLLGERVCL